MSDDRGLLNSDGNIPDAPNPPISDGSENLGVAGNNTGAGAPPLVANPPAAQKPQPQAQTPSSPMPTTETGDIRKHIFGKIWEGMGGGPTKVQVTDPNTGLSHIEVRHPSNGGIMKSIMAGALTGIIAGMSQPQQYMNSDQGPVRVPQGSQPFAAGATAEKQALDQKQQSAQGAEDQKNSKYYSVLKNNLDLHANQLNNEKLDEESNERAVAGAKPILDGMQQWQDAHPDSQPVFRAHGVPGHMLLEKYHISKDNALPDGRQPVIDPQTGEQAKNPDGSLKFETTYSVFDPNAMTQMSSQLRDVASQTNPALGKIPENTPIAAKILLENFNKSQNMDIAQSVLNSMMAKAAEMTGDKKKPTKIDLRAAIKKDPMLVQMLPYIGKYAGKDPDQMLDEMEKDHPEMIGRVQGLMQIDRTALATERDAEKKRLEREATNQEMIAKEKADGTYESRQVTTEKNKLEVEKLKKELAQTATIENGHENDPVVNGVRQTYLDSLSPAIRAQVKEIGEGRSTKPASLLRTKQGQVLGQAVSLAYPEYDVTKAEDYEKVRKSFTSGNDSKSIQAINVALAHTATMFKKVSAATTLPGISGVNAFFGGDAAGLRSDRAAVASELAKAYASGAFTQGEKDEWQAKLSASSPMELRRNLVEFAQLLKGKFSGLLNTWKNGVPRGFVQPVRIVGPDAAKAFNEITGDTLDSELTVDPATHVTSDMNPQANPQAQPQASVVPANKVAARDASGAVIGYADDPKGTNFVRFKKQ